MTINFTKRILRGAAALVIDIGRAITSGSLEDREVALAQAEEFAETIDAADRSEGGE